MPEAFSDVDKILEVLRLFDLEDACHKAWPNGTGVDYMPEAIILLQRVVERPLTAEFVRDVWLVMFATNDVLVRRGGYGGHRGRHGIEHRVEIGDMPMRPEFQEIADKVNRMFSQKVPR